MKTGKMTMNRKFSIVEFMVGMFFFILVCGILAFTIAGIIEGKQTVKTDNISVVEIVPTSNGININGEFVNGCDYIFEKRSRNSSLYFYHSKNCPNSIHNKDKEITKGASK